MRIPQTLIALALAELVTTTGLSQEVVLLDETFSSQSALDQWELHSSGDGQIVIIPDPGNPEGRVLLMDDTVSDSTYSKNVIRRKVDLEILDNLKLSYTVYLNNSEQDGEDETALNLESPFDGVVVELSTGERASTPIKYYFNFAREIYLENLFSAEALALAEYLFIELHQYGDESYPDSGMSWDNIRLTGDVTRKIFPYPPEQFSENEDILSLPVSILPIPDVDVPLTLMRGNDIIGTEMYPANKDTAVLHYAGFDNDTLAGNSVFRLKLTDNLYTSDIFELLVLDDEPSGLWMTAPPRFDESDGQFYLDVGYTMDAPGVVWIQLECKDSEVMAFTASTSLGTGQKSKSVRIYISRNPRITGNEEVTITARLGPEEVSATMLYVEGNSLTPNLNGPESMVEGKQDRLSVNLPALTDHVKKVHLSSNDPGLIFEETDLQFEPDDYWMSTTIEVVDNDAVQGNREVIITADVEGGGTVDFPLMIIDNDIHRFQIPDYGFLPIGGVFQAMLSGHNLEGDLVYEQSELLDIILVNTQNGSETVLTGGIEYTGGTMTIEIPVPESIIGDQLVIRSAGGMESVIGPVGLMTVLDFPAETLVYDAVRDKLYAATSDNAVAGYEQSITPIDPYTASFGVPLQIEGVWAQSAPSDITDDGQYLYLGLGHSHSIIRVDLDTFSLDKEIPLSSPGIAHEFLPLEIMTIPGRSLDIVVTQENRYGSEIVRAYFDGVVQPDGISDEWALTPSDVPDEFFGFNHGTTGHEFRKARLTETGFEVTDYLPEINSGSWFQMRSGNGQIITSTGSVIDMRTLEFLDSIEMHWSSFNNSFRARMAVDFQKSRIYYAFENEIAVYDLETRRFLGIHKLPGIGNIDQLVRFGATGIAARTQDDKLILIESTRLVPLEVYTDLEVQLDYAQVSVDSVDYLDYTYRVTNHGTEIASNVYVDFSFTDLLKFVSCDQDLSGTSAGKLSHFLGNLNPFEAVEISTRLKVENPETVFTTVTVDSALRDQDYSNNIATQFLLSGYQSKPNSHTIIKAHAVCLLYNPHNEQLVIGTGEEAPEGFSNHLISLDIHTGQVVWMTELSQEPGMLRLSDDGSTLYARTGIDFSRVNALTGSCEDMFRINSSSISDFEVLQGTTDSLITGAFFTGGIRIYDNGIVRPSTENNLSGRYISQVPGTNLVFAHTGTSPNSILQIQITPLEVKIVGLERNLFYPGNRLVTAGHLAFGLEGNVVNMLSLSVLGNLPFAEITTENGDLSLAPDPDKNRVFASRDKAIGSFDLQTFSYLGSVNISDLPQDISSLQRWGSDGFVSLLEHEGDVAIIRTDLVPDEPETNLINLGLNLDNPFITELQHLNLEGYASSTSGIASVTVNGELANTSNNYETWSKAITLQEGENLFTVSAISNGLNEPHEFTQRIIFDPNRGIDGFYADSWARAYLQVEALPEDWKSLDNDFDGYTNYQEYLLGMNPLTADLPILNQSLLHFGSSRIFGYRRLSAFADQYRVAISNDCYFWDYSESNITYLGESFPVESDDRYEDALFSVDSIDEEPFFIKVLIE